MRDRSYITRGGWTSGYTLLFAVYALAVASYFAPLIPEPDQVADLTKEDGLVEWIGAAPFLIASMVFFAAYLRSKDCEHRIFGIRTQGNLWLIGWAALSFVAFGEEISWGQRIFGWATPELWHVFNKKNETNLHNLWLFNPKNPDGTHKSTLEIMLNANRLFMAIWVLCCIISPVLAMSWRPARRFFDRAGFPVPPLAIGCLLLANYVAFRLIEALSGLDHDGLKPFVEVKETNYAFAFTLLALYFAVYRQPTKPLGPD